MAAPPATTHCADPVATAAALPLLVDAGALVEADAAAVELAGAEVEALALALALALAVDDEMRDTDPVELAVAVAVAEAAVLEGISLVVAGLVAEVFSPSVAVTVTG